MAKPPLRFPEFLSKAETLLSQPGRVQNLLQRGVAKLQRTSGGRLAELKDQVGTCIDLVRAWSAGDYRQVSNKTLVILLAALLYFVMPLDVVPDFIFGFGLLDDAAVLSYVFVQLTDEIQAFQNWQRENDAMQANVDDTQ